MTSIATNNFWCLVPAAGSGQRMGAQLPKQYLALAGQPLIYTTLSRLHQAWPEAKLLVALHPEDQLWPQIEQQLRKAYPQLQLQTCTGGTTRAESVLNGLKYLAPLAQAQDWVAVHDVARPCITAQDLHQLYTNLAAHPVGGLLAMPVTDTIKLALTSSSALADPQVASTVNRENLWQALTPQMFRFQLLFTALQQALQQGLAITDEASALEAAGYHPVLVSGRRDNLKVTHPEDLSLATWFLQQQIQAINSSSTQGH